MRTFGKRTLPLIMMLMVAANGLAQKINWMDYKKVSMQQVLDQAKKENKYVFVDIWTTWCGVCKAIDKYIFTRKDVSDFFNQHTVNLTFDAEYGAWRDVAHKFSATAYPTILIVNPQGEIVWAIDNLGVPTPQQHEASKSEVGERMMEQAKLGIQLEQMSDEQLTDSTTFALMKKYGVGFNTKAFIRLIDNKEVMLQKYGHAFVRLCKDALGGASANMLTYGEGGTHVVNENKMRIYEEVTRKLNLPDAPQLLLEPKLNVAVGLGKWQEVLDLTESNFNVMSPYMFAEVIGEMAEGCQDKTLMNRAAPIFKKVMNIKCNDREKDALTEAYHQFCEKTKQ